MKKIGILTFHKSYNYGAFMQCYSLVEKLKADFDDVQVEVIDYTTKASARQYYTSFPGYVFRGIKSSKKNKLKFKIILKNLYIYVFKHSIIRELRKRNECFEVCWKKLPLSEFCLVTDNYEAVIKEIKKQSYDIVIVGSDAVWNWVVRGFPNAYFLNGDVNAVKVSYAASCYGQDFQLINENQADYLKKALSSFFYIGVREKATEDFVKYIDQNLKPAHNCDPTVLLDIGLFDDTVEKIKEYLASKGVDTAKPIIGIMGNKWLGKLVRNILGDKYQIVAVYEPNEYADAFLSELTPFEWARVFSLFSVTFTHFFHGTMFSLKNLTPVFAVEAGTSAYALKYDTKIKDLLKRLDLLDFYYIESDIDDGKAVSISEKIDEFIFNPPTQRIMAAMEKEAESYNEFKECIEEILKKEQKNG